ncbi:MAG: hypothetical protein J6S67_18120 [Methanobrevibacter sp.]|nr:hypothetical protein [Methanobrevibacter sp.]
MSIWTHVAGVVRIDAIRFDPNDIPDFDTIFGREWTFDDMWDDEPAYTDSIENPDAFMPCGSEGSLEKSVWVNPDRNSMSAYTITIFGDLRDYDDPDAIVSWFKDCCKDVWVRQAIITVETEGKKPIIYNYKDKDPII